MKFSYISVLLILLVASSIVEARRVRSHHKSLYKNLRKNHYHRNHHRDAVEIATNLGQFGLGLATEIAGGVAIDSCLPEAWRNATPNQSEIDAVENNVVSEKTTWENFKNILGHTVDAICFFKELKTEAFKWIASKLGVTLRRHIRRLIQGKTRKRYRWEFDEHFFATTASKISAAAHSIKNGTVNVVNYVGKKIDEIELGIKTTLRDIFQPATTLLQGMKQKLHDFFGSSLMTNIVAFITCIKNLGNAVYLVAKTFTSITTTIASLASGSPIAWVEVIVGLICAYDDIKIAAGYLTGAFSETGAKRWNLIGRFVGKLIYILGNLTYVKDRRSMFYRR